MTIPRALLLALALLQAVGLFDYVRHVACAEECKTEGCDDKGFGDCSATACHCPGAPTLTETRRIAVVVAPLRTEWTVEFAHVDDVRTSPDPREILHVPKTFRA